MKHFIAFIILFSGLTFSATTLANWETKKPQSYTVDDPPAQGSYEELQEFEVLHDWEDKRTDRDCKFARDSAQPAFEIFWGKLFSEYAHERGLRSPFTERDIQSFKELIAKVMKHTEKVTAHYKAQYRRLRPYDADPTLKPCAKKPGGRKSYPSSHASKAMASACVLAEMYPKDADLILDFGKYMGELRVIGGVHHPSDVVTGQSIGLQVCEGVIAN